MVKGTHLNLPLVATYEYWKYEGTEENIDAEDEKYGEKINLSAIVYIDSADRRIYFGAKVLEPAVQDTADSAFEDNTGDSAYFKLDSMENTNGQYIQHGTASYYVQNGNAEFSQIQITVNHEGTISLREDHDMWKDNSSVMEFDLTDKSTQVTYHLVVNHYGPEHSGDVSKQGKIREIGSAYYANGRKMIDWTIYRWHLGAALDKDVRKVVIWYEDTEENKAVKKVTHYFNGQRDIEDLAASESGS